MNLLEAWVDALIGDLRAGNRRKRRMREELLSHLHEAQTRLRQQGMEDESAAWAAIEQMGDATLLQKQLQDSVPWHEQLAMFHFIRRRQNETLFYFSIRCALLVQVISLGVVGFFMALVAWTVGAPYGDWWYLLIIDLCAFPLMVILVMTGSAFYHFYFNGRVWAALGMSVISAAAFLALIGFLPVGIFIAIKQPPEVYWDPMAVIISVLFWLIFIPAIQFSGAAVTRRTKPWLIKRLTRI